MNMFPFPISGMNDLARLSQVDGVRLTVKHDAGVDRDSDVGARNFRTQCVVVDLDQELAMCAA